MNLWSSSSLPAWRASGWTRRWKIRRDPSHVLLQTFLTLSLVFFTRRLSARTARANMDRFPGVWIGDDWYLSQFGIRLSSVDSSQASPMRLASGEPDNVPVKRGFEHGANSRQRSAD